MKSHLSRQHQHRSSVSNPFAAGPVPQGGSSQAEAAPDALSRVVEAESDACGKAIIIGEHAVVYGATAVAMPLRSMRMSIRLVPSARREGRENGANKPIRLFLGGRPVAENIGAVVEDAFTALDIPPFAAELYGNSSIPIGAGLGSSAALCVALLKTLAQSTDKRLDPTELAERGNSLEQRFHGKPSGLDTAVVALESVVAFRKGSRPRPWTHNSIDTGSEKDKGPGDKPSGTGRPAPMPATRFVLLDTGVRSSTRTMIAAAKPYFGGVEGDRHVQRFDLLAETVVKALQARDFAAIGQAMDEAQSHLEDAGVSNQNVDELVRLARKHGALGAKLTGAGGGGCVLCLLPAGKEKAERLCSTYAGFLGANNVHQVCLP